MSRYHTLRVKEIRPETEDSVSILFDLPGELRDAFKFEAGQHIGIKAALNGDEIRRSYSICAAPAEGALRIGVKKVEGGKFSTFANDVLEPGDEVEVLPPQGSFTHIPEPKHRGLYVFFAAGSGITPVISMISTILGSEPLSEVLLFYGNRNSESIMFKEELEALKNRFGQRIILNYILSREPQSSPVNTGRIDKDKCEIWSRVFFITGEVDKYFICGPEAMINEVREWLLSKDVPTGDIKFELFTTPANPPVVRAEDELDEIDSAKESMIQIQVDGAVVEFPLRYKGESILDAATEAGADVPFSCKGGVCCTCKAKLTDGDVVMDVVYGLEPDEIEAGYILTCQAHPRTEKVSVDYDI